MVFGIFQRVEEGVLDAAGPKLNADVGETEKRTIIRPKTSMSLIKQLITSRRMKTKMEEKKEELSVW